MSNFLMQDGVQESILSAVRRNLPEETADVDIEGLKKGLIKSLQELQVEAARVEGVGKTKEKPETVEIKFTGGRRAREQVEKRKEVDRRLKEEGRI